MIYRDFQGLKLSGLGLGMMRLPVVEGDNNVIDEEKAAEIVDLAYKSGINYFDTAWGYHGGNSELMAGKLLTKYPRESYYLATKFPGYDKANMAKGAEIFEKQLEKCRTPYFDFYLYHNVNEGNVDPFLDPQYGLLDYFLEQKKNGRIRHLGFSCHGSLETLKKFLDAVGEHMEFCQLQMNYLDWHFQDGEKKLALLRERNIPLWVMEPVRGGRLVKVQGEIAAMMESAHPEMTPPEWAFRFLQTIPEVGMVLSGMSTLDQLKENLRTWSTDAPLTQAEFDGLVKAADAEVTRVGVPCTACRYCTTYCPQELPIPNILTAYNEAKLSGGQTPMSIRMMAEDKRPHNCVGCRSCEEVCPQQIKISEVMSDFADMIQKNG